MQTQAHVDTTLYACIFVENRKQIWRVIVKNSFCFLFHTISHCLWDHPLGQIWMFPSSRDSLVFLSQHWVHKYMPSYPIFCWCCDCNLSPSFYKAHIFYWSHYLKYLMIITITKISKHYFYNLSHFIHANYYSLRIIIAGQFIKTYHFIQWKLNHHFCFINICYFWDKAVFWLIVVTSKN